MLIEDIARLDRSVRVASLGALLLIVIVAMYGWMVTPHANCLSAAQRYESAAVSVTARKQEISQKVEKKRGTLRRLQEDLEKFRSIVFDEKQAEEFFSDLQVIAKETSCVVYSLNLPREKEKATSDKEFEDVSGVALRKATLSVVGAYRNVVSFIERLQTRPQRIWLDPIAMELMDRNMNEIRCDVTITICVVKDKESVIHE